MRTGAGEGLRLALEELGRRSDAEDIRIRTDGIGAMLPFPEVVGALRRLKSAGSKLCIVSNTDDEIIASNVARLDGSIDRVITAQQARVYKPARGLFDHAHSQLDVSKDDVVHICASPHLDHAAARDIGFPPGCGTARACKLLHWLPRSHAQGWAWAPKAALLRRNLSGPIPVAHERRVMTES